jgi:hypothetical protein
MGRLMSEYRKGDRCRILDGGRVEHYDCDMYADGFVTDVAQIEPV